MNFSPQSVWKKTRMLLGPAIALELGSGSVRLNWLGSEQIVEEATLLATSSTSKTVVFGNEAREMHGRIAQTFSFDTPIDHGWVNNVEALKKLLQFCIHQLGMPVLMRPVWMVSIPSTALPVDHALITEVLFQLGAREVIFIPQLLAAAIGAGLPIADTSGNLFVQLGSGVSECAIISLGNIVVSKSLPVGGRELDQGIRALLRQTHQLDVSFVTAAQIKEQLASVRREKNDRISVKGRDVTSNMPKEVSLHTQDIEVAVRQWSTLIVGLITRLFQELPSSLAHDVIEKGALMAGGQAELVGLDIQLSQTFNIPFSVAEDPKRCVIKGTIVALEHLEEYKNSLFYQR